MTDPDTTSPNATPAAIITPQRRWSLAWLVVAAVAVFAVWLAIDAWLARGHIVAVQFTEAHGLAPGAPVRHRGVIVGEVRRVELDREHVAVTLALRPGDAHLASRGARFWIVRPQVALDRVENLDTILGAKYVAIEPGNDGPAQSFFVGIDDAPVVLERHDGDLEVIVHSAQRSGLHRGAPVTYRDLRIGTVISVGLTSDGGAVETRVHIRQPYVALIREETRFWANTGVKAELGLRGFALEVGSLESLVTGALALATPPGAGPPVHTGHIFRLADSPFDDWLKWQPHVAIGSELLPPGASMPGMLRAKLVWEEGRVGRFLRTERERRGWLLPIEGGLLGPHNLLAVGGGDDVTNTALHVAGASIPLDAPLHEISSLLAHRGSDVDLRTSGPPWPRERMRAALAPEDCLIVADDSDPLPIALSRLTPGPEGTWLIDRAVPIERDSQGAAVVARSDGRIIGILVVLSDEDEHAAVALLPSDFAGAPAP